MKLEDLTGRQYGYWTVVRYLGHSNWECVCKCGTVRSVTTYRLKSGKSKSCGCFRAENAKKFFSGKKVDISEATRSKMSASAKKRGMAEEVWKKGVERKAQSEKGGRTPKNRNAKIWCIISPDHEMYEISNLRDFVRMHDYLFLIDGEDDKEVTQICAAFSNLKRNMRLGKQKTCCNGWSIIIPDDDRINKYKD